MFNLFVIGDLGFTFWCRTQNGIDLRRSEVVALKLADYEPETGRILVRSGKGGKDRAVFLVGRRKAALDR
jgi:site-specific recombinase XerD